MREDISDAVDKTAGVEWAYHSVHHDETNCRYTVYDMSNTVNRRTNP